MSLRVERDAVVYLRVVFEELLQYLIVVLGLFVKRQVHLRYRHIGEVVAHVVTESRFTVLLLFGGHVAVPHLLHQHDLLFLRGNEHQHAGCEVSALERVLAVERQRPQVGHVRVEQDEGYLFGVQLVGEVACQFQCGRHYDHSIGLLLQTVSRSLLKGLQVEPLVVDEFHRDAEVAPMVTRGQTALLYFLPVSLRLVLGQQAVEGVSTVVSQRRGIHVGPVVHLFQCLVHLLQCFLRHIGPLM